MRGLNDGGYQLVPPWLPGIGRHAVGLRCLDRPAALVQPARPVHLDERLAEQEPAGRALEHVEVAVAVGPQHGLHVGAVPVQIGEHRHLHRIVVVGVVRRELEMPSEPAGVGVERDDRVGVEVVARPLRRIPVGTGVAHAPIREIQIGIVRAGQPDRSAAMLPGLGIAIGLRIGRARLPGLVAGLAGTGNGVEAPGLLAGLGVVGGDEAADAQLAAADADDDLVLDDERRQRQRVARPSSRRP